MTNEEVREYVNSLNKMTPRDALRLVKIVFIENQTPPSVNMQKTRCLYAPGLNGVGCAFAVLVPDRMKDYLIENRCAGSLVVTEPELEEFFGYYNEGFYNRLQEWHDKGLAGVENHSHDTPEQLMQDIERAFKVILCEQE